jgi:predicted dithiol-disulfide oxidoreductase (DUF899 family)
MQHQTVSPDEWLPARRELLAKEKELTRHRDEVNKARRRDHLLGERHGLLLERAYAGQAA